MEFIGALCNVKKCCRQLSEYCVGDSIARINYRFYAMCVSECGCLLLKLFFYFCLSASPLSNKETHIFSFLSKKKINLQPT